MSHVSPEFAAAWFDAFLLTMAIEVPIYLLLLHKRLTAPGALLVGVAAQCLTHPFLWFVAYEHLYFSPYEAWLVAAELGVTAAEALLVRSLVPSWAIAVSTALLANLISTLIGLAL